MAVADSVETWTASARQIIDLFKKVDSEEYIPITFSGLANLLKIPIWQYDDVHDAYSDPAAVLTDLRGYLAASADDVAARWTVLAFLYDLCEGLAEYDEDDEDADESDFWSEEERAPFREELSALVSLPEIARINDSARAVGDP